MKEDLMLRIEAWFRQLDFFVLTPYGGMIIVSGAGQARANHPGPEQPHQSLTGLLGTVLPGYVSQAQTHN